MIEGSLTPEELWQNLVGSTKVRPLTSEDEELMFSRVPPQILKSLMSYLCPASAECFWFQVQRVRGLGPVM